MKINSIFLNNKDNVITTLKEMEKDSEVIYQCENELLKLIVQEDVPEYHKVAIVDIRCGEYVYKYGEIIGVAQKNIMKGQFVSHLNINSVPRDYSKENYEMTGA
ncbi:altronate dehydratase small subunit [Dethiosulfatibacter aminovorans DSM 17477]|uniref:Altronate dehydratase small subunit n=1 Tax=Dethiosulfatibacter aminovorans DSM 17477 TaxID=1121476 RepID=A0A1M6AW64_9FIRM|nr:UxaA family hydrolase [Dethiosulfatibacter aminovorans]SHI40680.1 altronate dehydratase small subunit [Dethiosulfatibacter aminovorans DSM 17477]